MRTWSAPDAARAAGTTYRCVESWARWGIVTPAIEAHGSGTQRRYTADEVVAVAIVAAITAAGFRLALRAPEVVASGKEFGVGRTDPLLRHRIVLAARSAEALPAYLEAGGPFLVVNIPAIRAAVEHRTAGAVTA